MILSEVLVLLINVFFIGNLGSASMLAGIGMAHSIAGITTNPVVVGFNAVLASYIP